MTNEESYESFKEICNEEVRNIMEETAREKIEVYSRRPESADRQNRLRYAADVLPNKFPSQSWWLEHRPREVVLMHDHTPGLCKVCVLYVM